MLSYFACRISTHRSALLLASRSPATSVSSLLQWRTRLLPTLCGAATLSPHCPGITHRGFHMAAIATSTSLLLLLACFRSDSRRLRSSVRKRGVAVILYRQCRMFSPQGMNQKRARTGLAQRQALHAANGRKCLARAGRGMRASLNDAR